PVPGLRWRAPGPRGAAGPGATPPGGGLAGSPEGSGAYEQLGAAEDDGASLALFLLAELRIRRRQPGPLGLRGRPAGSSGRQDRGALNPGLQEAPRRAEPQDPRRAS